MYSTTTCRRRGVRWETVHFYLRGLLNWLIQNQKTRWITKICSRFIDLNNEAIGSLSFCIDVFLIGLLYCWKRTVILVPSKEQAQLSRESTERGCALERVNAEWKATQLQVLYFMTQVMEMSTTRGRFKKLIGSGTDVGTLGIIIGIMMIGIRGAF